MQTNEQQPVGVAEANKPIESTSVNASELTQILRKEDFISSAFLLKLTLALVVLLISAAFLLRFLKRRFPNFQGDFGRVENDRVVVRSSSKLSARSKIFLVSVGAERFLVAESTNSLVMTKIHSVKEVASDDALGEQV